MASHGRTSLGLVEISALTAAMIVLDAMDKAAKIRVLQAELNDYYGYLIKIVGDSASLHEAIDTARSTADQLKAPCQCVVIDAPDERSWPAIESPPEHQPLIEQDVVFFPATQQGTPAMTSSHPFAIGFIETQGFTAVVQAIDTACKAANVTVLGREKLGGGYITIMIRGDVAAVNAAVQAGRTEVEKLGKLIAAHVIARPSEQVLGLLPQG